MKNSLKVLFVISLIMVIGMENGCGSKSSSNSSPTSFSISGIVNGSVYQGVTINLIGAATAITTTDASGSYAFTNLSPLLKGAQGSVIALQGRFMNPPLHIYLVMPYARELRTRGVGKVRAREILRTGCYVDKLSYITRSTPHLTCNPEAAGWIYCYRSRKN